MATTKYVPGTVVTSPWLNDADTATYDRLTTVVGTNALTAVGPLSMSAYVAGQNFYFVASAPNTGAVTLNITANAIPLGVKSLVKSGTAPLVTGDLVANTAYHIYYDGTNFQLINPGIAPYSGGSVPAANITGQVAVANGGTGAATAAQALINLGATGRLVGVQTFTANGTYTPNALATSVVVKLVGAGGGGGSAAATAAANISLASGGGGGGYTEGRFLSPGSQTVTVGVGGAGGTAGGSGAAGGTTSFGALATALGGAGGLSTASAAQATAAGVAGGGVGTGGNIVAIPGAGSPHSFGTASLGGGGGAGAPGPLGGSTPAVAIVVTGSVGLPATGMYGAGGGGAANNASQAARSGGIGGGGLVIVYEYA